MDDLFAVVGDFLDHIFGCSACPLRFSSSEEFRLHVCPPRIKCNGYIRKACKGDSFPTFEEMSAHFLRVHFKKNACWVCCINFSTDEKKIAHIKSRHVEEIERSEKDRTMVVREDRHANTPPAAAPGPSTSTTVFVPAATTSAAAAAPSTSTATFRPHPAASAASISTTLPIRPAASTRPAHGVEQIPSTSAAVRHPHIAAALSTSTMAAATRPSRAAAYTTRPSVTANPPPSLAADVDAIIERVAAVRANSLAYPAASAAPPTSTAAAAALAAQPRPTTPSAAMARLFAAARLAPSQALDAIIEEVAAARSPPVAARPAAALPFANTTPAVQHLAATSTPAPGKAPHPSTAAISKVRKTPAPPAGTAESAVAATAAPMAWTASSSTAGPSAAAARPAPASSPAVGRTVSSADLAFASVAAALAWKGSSTAGPSTAAAQVRSRPVPAAPATSSAKAPIRNPTPAAAAVTAAPAHAAALAARISSAAAATPIPPAATATPSGSTATLEHEPRDRQTRKAVAGALREVVDSVIKTQEDEKTVAEVMKTMINAVIQYENYQRRVAQSTARIAKRRREESSEEMPAKRVRTDTPGHFPSPPPTSSDEAMEVSTAPPILQPTLADLTPPTTISPVPVASSSISQQQPKHSPSREAAPAAKLYPIFNLVRSTAGNATTQPAPAVPMHTSTPFAVDFLTSRPQGGMPRTVPSPQPPLHREIKEEPMENPPAPTGDAQATDALQRSINQLVPLLFQRAALEQTSSTPPAPSPLVQPPLVPDQVPAQPLAPAREVKQEPVEPADEEAPIAPNPPLRMTIRLADLERSTSAASTVQEPGPSGTNPPASVPIAPVKEEPMDEAPAEEELSQSEAAAAADDQAAAMEQAGVEDDVIPEATAALLSPTLDHTYLASTDHNYALLAGGASTIDDVVGSTSSVPLNPLDLAPIPPYKALHGDVKEEAVDESVDKSMDDPQSTYAPLQPSRTIDRADLASFLSGFVQLAEGIGQRIAAGHDNEQDQPMEEGEEADGPSTSGIVNATATDDVTPADDHEDAREGYNGQFPEDPLNESINDGPSFALPVTPSTCRRSPRKSLEPSRRSLRTPKMEISVKEEESPINWAEEYETKPEWRLRERRSRTVKPEPMEGEREISEDEKFWTCVSDSHNCPRCGDFFINKENLRRIHYKKMHYDILFGGEERRMNCDQWLCWKLGAFGDENEKDDRACLQCEPGSELHRGRIPLIKHQKNEHKPYFKQLKEQYRLHSRVRPAPADTQAHMKLQ